MRTSTMHLTENKLQLMSFCQCNNPWIAIKYIRESNQPLWGWGAERRKSPTCGRENDAAASDFRLNKTRNYQPVIQRLQLMPCSCSEISIRYSPVLSVEIVSYQEPAEVSKLLGFLLSSSIKIKSTDPTPPRIRSNNSTSVWNIFPPPSTWKPLPFTPRSVTLNSSTQLTP